jgi:hypothetical protein
VWIWIAFGAVVLAVVLAVVVVRRRGARSAGSGSGFQMTANELRVSWPPGYANTRPIRTVRKPDALYLIEAFGTRSAALAFLRGCEVRDERIYVIAENPQGNLGKDLIMIFEEADGAFVEIAERSPLPAPRRSTEDCARCGYSVIPASHPGTIGIDTGEGAVEWLVALDDMEMSGHGHQCLSCRALACARCYQSVPQSLGPGGQLDLRCWLCGGGTDVFTE